MSYQMKLYARIAQIFDAFQNCTEKQNLEWRDNHMTSILGLVREYMPRGSGIDNGVAFDFDASKKDKLVFTFGYHCMNDGGYYDGWIDYTLTVKPNLARGYDMRITGRDYHGNKEYFYDLLADALNTDVTVLTYAEREAGYKAN